MSESTKFLIKSLQHSGAYLDIIVEESSRLRRLTFVRSRKVMGELKKVGEVHIYVDSMNELMQALETAHDLMEAIGRDGLAQVVDEVKSGVRERIEVFRE